MQSILIHESMDQFILHLQRTQLQPNAIIHGTFQLVFIGKPNKNSARYNGSHIIIKGDKTLARFISSMYVDELK